MCGAGGVLIPNHGMAAREHEAPGQARTGLASCLCSLATDSYIGGIHEGDEAMKLAWLPSLGRLVGVC